MGAHRVKFAEQGISGELLFELTQPDLKEDLGVAVLGSRLKILKAIKEDLKPAGSNALVAATVLTKRAAIEQGVGLPPRTKQQRTSAGSSSRAQMPSSSGDFVRLESSAVKFKQAPLTKGTPVVLKCFLIAPPFRAPDVVLKSGLRAGTSVPKVELQVMDVAGEVSRVSFLFASAEEVAKDMKEHQTYFITQLSARAVSPGYVSAGVEFSAWSPVEIFAAPAHLQLKSTSADEQTVLSKLNTVQIGQQVEVEGRVVSVSALEQDGALRKVVLAEDGLEKQGEQPHAVVACLWRRYAERFVENLIGSRILLSGVRVSEFKGATQLVSTNATHWEEKGERVSEETLPRELQFVSSSDTYFIDAASTQPLMSWEDQPKESAKPYVAKVSVTTFTVRSTNVCPKCASRVGETFGSGAQFW